MVIVETVGWALVTFNHVAPFNIMMQIEFIAAHSSWRYLMKFPLLLSSFLCARACSRNPDASVTRFAVQTATRRLEKCANANDALYGTFEAFQLQTKRLVSRVRSSEITRAHKRIRYVMPVLRDKFERSFVYFTRMSNACVKKIQDDI